MGIPWHECGILPKNCRVAPPPLDMQTAPCDTWHRSFHPDISHPEFFPADIPPGYLTSGILLRRHSTFSGYLTSGILSGRCFTFSRYLTSVILSGQTCPNPLIALTWRASTADNLDSPDSLAHQTLAIRRIHFRPQSKSKL